MRTLTSATTAAVLLLALSGCADDADDADDAAAPLPPYDPETSTAVSDVSDLAASQAVVDQFYDAIGQHDCITLRGLSTLAEQQEDDAWADCIDVLLAIAGDGYTYSVGGASAFDDRVTYTVSVTSTVDGAPVTREDPLRLLEQDGTWRVDDSVVTSGA